MPSSKAAVREEARRTFRYVDPLNEARTLMADFSSSLLGSDGSLDKFGPSAEIGGPANLVGVVVVGALDKIE